MPKRLSLWLVVAAALLLAGCPSIKLISDYDEKLDQGVSELQKKVEKILSKIESSPQDPKKTYAEADYAEIKQDLSVLITRASSWDKNDLTVKQLYNLGYALLADPLVAPEDLKLAAPDREQSLQGRHNKSEAFKPQDLVDLRGILNVDFQAILKLELAKKRGASSTATSK